MFYKLECFENQYTETGRYETLETALLRFAQLKVLRPRAIIMLSIVIKMSSGGGEEVL